MNAQNIKITYREELKTADFFLVAYSTTDENGLYQILISAKGNFILKVNFLGYTPQQQMITIADETKFILNFTLEENAILLDAIDVKGRQTGIKFGRIA